MASLKVGRVGFDVTIAGPRDWQIDGKRHRLRGVLNPKTTLANAQSLRSELTDQIGQVVAVTYDSDATFDGFYRVLDVKVDANHADAAILNTGLFRFDLSLELIGTYSSAEFQSLLDHQVHSNDHGLIAGELNWWHSGPIDRVAYTLLAGSGSPGEITRVGADGTLNVAIGIPDTSPQFTSSPENFYKGGCYVKVNGFTRTGVDVPMSVIDFELGNSLVKVTPGLTTGASNGQIEVAHYDTSAYATAKAYTIKYATTTAIVKWSKFRIIRNTPELCIIELVDDANEAGGNKYTRHTLTLGVRRGGLLVYGFYNYDGAAATYSLDRSSVEASTAITPTGASSVMAIRATSNDGDGNRFVLGSSKTTTQDTTNGGLDFASTNEFDFFISSEIDGSSAQTQDQAGNQCLQYLAVSNEQVRPIPR
jgi:hypothetical protein